MKIHTIHDAVVHSVKRKLSNEVARNRPVVMLVGSLHARRVGELPTYWPDEQRAKPSKGKDAKRITALSWKSRARAMWTLGEVLGDVRWNYFLTLTYQIPPTSGKASKAHLNKLLDSLASGVMKIGAKMFWWLEFQERGAIHYHVLLSNVSTPYQEKVGNLLGSHYTLPKDKDVLVLSSGWLCRRWTEIIGQINEDTLRHSARWEMINNPKGVGKYLIDYCNKKGQKTVPEWVESVGRFWGVRGCAVERSAVKATDKQEMAARGYLRVVMPAHMLAGITETSGADALPYAMQWNKAQEIREWLATPEGAAYQHIAPGIVWSDPLNHDVVEELECFETATLYSGPIEQNYSDLHLYGL